MLLEKKFMGECDISQLSPDTIDTMCFFYWINKHGTILWWLFMKYKMLHVLYMNTYLIKEAFFLVIINTWFWPVFKQVHLALIQQHFCKFNLESPGNKRYFLTKGNKNYTRRKLKHGALIHHSDQNNSAAPH
jgi:hypothetical protein